MTSSRLKLAHRVKHRQAKYGAGRNAWHIFRFLLVKNLFDSDACIYLFINYGSGIIQRKCKLKGASKVSIVYNIIFKKY